MVAKNGSGRENCFVKLAQLRPTQIAVGYEEVGTKRSKWRALSAGEKLRFSRLTLFLRYTDLARNIS